MFAAIQPLVHALVTVRSNSIRNSGVCPKKLSQVASGNDLNR